MRRTYVLLLAVLGALLVSGLATGSVQSLITGSQIKDGSIDSRDLKPGSIMSHDIKDGSITKIDLSNATVKALKGQTGATGLQGATGPQGAAGPQGATGPQGIAGPKGATGPQGAQGPKGDTGEGIRITGTAATVEDLPETAEVGDSYLVGGNLWVWNGDDWANAGPVVGPQGATGPTGDTGPTGPAGPAGPMGPAGGVSGYQVVTGTTSDVDAWDASTASVACPTGKVALGGGAHMSSPWVNAATSYPVFADGAWAWVVEVFNWDEDYSASVTPYVICAVQAGS